MMDIEVPPSYCDILMMMMMTALIMCRHYYNTIENRTVNLCFDL